MSEQLFTLRCRFGSKLQTVIQSVYLRTRCTGWIWCFFWFCFVKRCAVRISRSNSSQTFTYTTINPTCVYLLSAQTASQRCRAPVLNGGFFVPGIKTFNHGTKLTYSCNDGLKPVSSGWWATSTCQNGRWSDPPQCIGKFACNALCVFLSWRGLECMWSFCHCWHWTLDF